MYPPAPISIHGVTRIISTACLTRLARVDPWVCVTACWHAGEQHCVLVAFGKDSEFSGSFMCFFAPIIPKLSTPTSTHHHVNSCRDRCLPIWIASRAVACLWFYFLSPPWHLATLVRWPPKAAVILSTADSVLSKPYH